MKTLLGILVVTFALVIASAASAAPGDVKCAFAAPCHYPTGLATDGTNFYLADWRAAKLYKVDASDGHVLATWDAPTLRPHGLTFSNDHLFISDDHTGMIYELDPATGVVERSFSAPGSRAVGLAFAGDALFVLEAGSRKIYKVMPDDGTILGYFDAPDRACECLGYDGTHLWVSNRIDDEIYMVDPESGMVLGVLESPGPYPAGLAWKDGYLWNVDFQNDTVSQIVIDDGTHYRLSDPREARIEYVWALSNYGPGKVDDLTVRFALPQDLPNQKLLSDIAYSVPPTRQATDQWRQPCAIVEAGAIAAGEKKTLGFSVDARVSAIHYLIMPEKTGTLDDIPADIRKKYTADGSRYRINTPYIQETVKKIVGDEKNPYWIARKIYNYLIDHLEYEMVGGWDVPEVVLNRGSGSCSEYTFSFIALCRAAGLPARYQGSVVVRGDDASIDEAFHRWAQVYLPNYGWVPVDANRGDSPSQVARCKGFGELADRFLITTQDGGDSEYLGWGYNSNATYKMTGYCNLSESNFGFWEPLKGDTRDKRVAQDAAGTCQ